MCKKERRVMIIQVFGKKSCNNTKKAERFFKERNVKIQFIDLNKYPISKGELKVITNIFPIEELLDIEGNEYKKRNLQYFVYDTEELLNENPILYKTPICRHKNSVTLGYEPEIWKEWIKK
jgi:arsenate reductase-like glutaredoxin family protein